MKRTKISQKRKNEADEVRSSEIQYSGPSFADLPSNILTIILLKLSVKRIVICKCVCKTWNRIISDPEFAKLHFSQVDIYPMIRTSDPARMSRILHLVQQEQEDDFLSRISSKHVCDCQADIKLDTKLKLPVRNFPLELDDHIDENGGNECCCLKLKAKHHKYQVVNSCNGLLCLSQLSYNKPVAVCNPVTGEFINLPGVKMVEDSNSCKGFIDCGLGFNPLTNQYKVIRIFEQPRYFGLLNKGKERKHGRLAEVYTLGTESWRNVGFTPYKMSELAFPTYFNGAIHWLCLGDDKSEVIVSFNIEKESFQSVSPPPAVKAYNRENVSLSVLAGCLCICDSCNDIHDHEINVWLMKDYGTKKSWSKFFSIDTYCEEPSWPYDGFGLYQPLKLLEDGGVLIFHGAKSVLIYYHPIGKDFVFFTIEGIKSMYEAIAHKPSFISLKDILVGENAEVLRISSRCAQLKLEGETRGISLVKLFGELDLHSDSSGSWDSDTEV